MTVFYIPEKCLKCGKGKLRKLPYLDYYKCTKCGAIHVAISEKNLIGVSPEYKDKLTVKVHYRNKTNKKSKRKAKKTRHKNSLKFRGVKRI